MPLPRAVVWSERIGLLIRVLVLVGYPFVGIAVANLGVESTTVTVPYRVFVLGLAMFVILARTRRPLLGRLDLLLLTFFAVYAIRLFWDWQFHDIVGASNSLLFFSMTVVGPVVATMLAGSNNLDDDILAKFTMMMGLVVLATVLVSSELGLGHNPWAEQGVDTTRLMFDALNPISLGNCAGVTLIASTFLLMETRQARYMRVLSYCGIILSAWVILAANSRGPLIAVALALVWLVVLRFRRMAYIAPFLLILPLFIPNLDQKIDNVVERFSGPLLASGSNLARVQIQDAAIKSFEENPLFGEHYIDGSFGVGSYPHNILIETAMALGLAGLTLLAAMLFRSFVSIFSFYKTAHPLIVMLLTQQLVALQFSGAIWGADAFFMLLGATLTARKLPWKRLPRSAATFELARQRRSAMPVARRPLH
ncbi:O-antigen ligase family protein [Mesorhizobium sp.]|uniref:O-antigen ligase family protein n=1 Tax=Mesorhizobium sp. TaxID=1871066 RepID=UPI000FE95A97|nr:O-antigen ligase family protein [Mesorhizobium sp.]RWQ53024.1 MAG: O-antigen ligase domain-containing protein [Mesorhizobium sp.]